MNGRDKKEKKIKKKWKKCLGCELWNCFMQLWYEQTLKQNYIRSLIFISLIKIYFVQVYIIIIKFINIFYNSIVGKWRIWILIESVSWVIDSLLNLMFFRYWYLREAGCLMLILKEIHFAMID